MSDPELTNCARRMWDKMCEEHKLNQGYVLDGDKQVKFSVTTSVKEGSKNFNRFLEEKKGVVEYLKKFGGPSLERYINLCQKPVKIEKKRKLEQDNLIDEWEGMNKLSKEEFHQGFIFESEPELVEALQSKFFESLMQKNLSLFVSLQLHIKTQSERLSGLLRETNGEILDMQVNLDNLMKKRENIEVHLSVFSKAEKKSTSMFEQLVSKGQFKSSFIDNFDEHQFIEEAFSVYQEIQTEESEAKEKEKAGQINDN